MDYQKKRKSILGEMAQIQGMKKGRLSEEVREKHKDGKTVRLGPYYKHQQWEGGRNVSRRIPADEADLLRKQIDGYHQFRELADEFVDVTVKMTQKDGLECKKSPNDSFGGDERNRELCCFCAKTV